MLFSVEWIHHAATFILNKLHTAALISISILNHHSTVKCVCVRERMLYVSDVK